MLVDVYPLRACNEALILPRRLSEVALAQGHTASKCQSQNRTSEMCLSPKSASFAHLMSPWVSRGSWSQRRLGCERHWKASPQTPSSLRALMASVPPFSYIPAPSPALQSRSSGHLWKDEGQPDCSHPMQHTIIIPGLGHTDLKETWSPPLARVVIYTGTVIAIFKRGTSNPPWDITTSFTEKPEAHRISAC